ncbi:MAG: hypothetical protein IKR82_00150 [Bacteroidales bacterium]|jgi:hypothetical protein|nr:hypothetical protein [Bacteroidales bacterium]
MKRFYENPQVEVAQMYSENVICGSGNTTEDFGKGTPIDGGIFDSIKPF